MQINSERFSEWLSLRFVGSYSKVLAYQKLNIFEASYEETVIDWIARNEQKIEPLPFMTSGGST